MSIRPEFGLLDALLQDKTSENHPNPTFLVLKKTMMKDKQRSVVLLTDGGSNFSHSGQKFFIRCIIRQGGGELPEGAFVKLTKYTTSTTMNSETIIQCDDFDFCGIDPEFDPRDVATMGKHPLNESGPNKPEVQNPNVQTSSGNMDSSNYGPVRASVASASRQTAPFSSYNGPPAVSRMPESQTFISIKDLSVFVQRWTIKARISTKADIRRYSNARGEGQLFSTVLVDKDGGEIKATFFQKASEKFFPLLDEGKVYTFSKGQIKSSNRKFNTINHTSELTFGEDAIIEPVDDDPQIPGRQYCFVPIQQINSKEKGEMVDILGVVIGHSDVQVIQLKQGGGKEKRDVTVLDQSGSSIDLTLWGSWATDLSNDILQRNPLISVKAAKVDDYYGKRLSNSFSSHIELDPNLPEAAHLKKWFNFEGQKIKPVSLTTQNTSTATAPKVNIAELTRQASLSSNADQVEDKGMYFTVIATLFHIITEGRRIFWVSCPDCRKKVKAIGESNFSGGVQQDDDIQYFCETCNKSVSTPVKKYVLSIEIQDESDELTCTIMAENAEALICLPVDNLLAYKTELSQYYCTI
eukprot:GHVP01023471.1.p1 GENE.GHVP01023471.1~~GHVP01023471.1.p1  ORF type:complete len:580 (+),score=100.40 GHVP01023471.1:45-1784(+)